MTNSGTSSWPTQQVVSAAQQGDPRAISTLLCGSHAHVQRFARTLCSTPEDAEAAAQEALIVLYRKIGTLRATAALASHGVVRAAPMAGIAPETAVSAPNAPVTEVYWVRGPRGRYWVRPRPRYYAPRHRHFWVDRWGHRHY